jgi:hypothetical protein
MGKEISAHTERIRRMLADLKEFRKVGKGIIEVPVIWRGL